MPILAVCLALIASTAVAMGHSFYDPWCCSGKDCAPIPQESVKVSRRGYTVTICPGDHPLVTESCINKHFGFDEARPSEDGAYHACIYPAGEIRCLYAPQGGV